jgi:hypothetical protein
VEVERAFSKAGLVVSSRRTKLSLEATAAQMIVGDWAKQGFLHKQTFLNAFGNANAKQTASTSTSQGTSTLASSSRDVIEIDDEDDDDDDDNDEE